jgi:hypothetical protein
MTTKAPKQRRRRRSPKTSNETTFIVRIAKDLSEYADVAVEAADASEAEELVTDLLSKPSRLDDLNYEAGDDREGPYTCDSWESDGEDQVPLTIRNGVPILPPARTKLTCPNCNYDGEKPSEHGGTFRYLADITTWREIIRLKKSKPNPTLIIEGLSDKYDEDEEKNERIECRACLREFPIPAGLKTDFR